jgi:hypothetical protein
MRWSQLEKSCRVANDARAAYAREEADRRALEAFGNDVLARACGVCGTSLAEVDPYDLIGLGGDALVCADCFALPSVKAFRDMTDGVWQ